MALQVRMRDFESCIRVFFEKAKGGSKSCGCLAKELLAARNILAAKHNMSDSRLYRIWAEVKQRCYNPKATSYENYGGRGIKMCEAWLDSFESFLNGPLPMVIQTNCRLTV